MPLSNVAEWFYRAEIEALLSETDLTYQQIATRLGVSVRTIQNYVSGETRPKAGMIAMLAQICGANEMRVNFLTHVISQLDSGRIVSDLNERNIFIVERAEAKAGEFWKWEPWYIPGPLQIERYHMEVLPEPSKNMMQNWQRKYRRFVKISRRRPAPAMRFLLSTNALHQFRIWDGAEQQFNHLLQINEWPNCEIRILDGLHNGVDHSFDIFQPGGFPEAPPSFIYVETLDQSRHIEEAMTVDLYYGRVRQMWSDGQKIGGRLDDWIR